MLPAIRAGNDVLAAGPSGAGTSAAALLGVLCQLISTPRNVPRNKAMPLALLLCPSRELAVQLAAQGAAIVAGTQLMVKCATGGSPVTQQVSCFLYVVRHENCVVYALVTARRRAQPTGAGMGWDVAVVCPKQGTGSAAGSAGCCDCCWDAADGEMRNRGSPVTQQVSYLLGLRHNKLLWGPFGLVTLPNSVFS
jgi:hypothetical protein